MVDDLLQIRSLGLYLIDAGFLGVEKQLWQQLQRKKR